MTTSIATSSSVFLQGLALSLGLIVAIGAQNAFVLRQGLRREHVGSVVLFCEMADAVSLQIAGTPAHVKRRGYCVALAEVGPIAAHVQAQPTALVVSIAAELRSAEQRFVLRSSRFPASQLEEAPSSSKARNR